MNINDIIQKIAEEHHTTPKEVYTEMQIAIEAAFKNTNPEIQKEWEKIPFQGECPKPEEVISYLASQLMTLQKVVS